MRYARAILTSLSIIVLVAFGVRLAFFYSGQMGAKVPIISYPPFGYETGAIAASIATGHGFSSPLGLKIPSGPTAWLTPVYPYLLAGVFKLYGVYTYASLCVIVVINCVFSALTCIPIYFAARRLAGPVAAALAAWIWALYMQAIITPIQWVWDTSLAALVCACILWATLEIRDSRRPLHWLAYGALWAFGLMVNASLAAVAPFVLIWLFLQLRNQQPRAHELRQPALIEHAPDPPRRAELASLRSSHALRLPALALLAIIVGCAPWTARNAIVFHRFIPFRSNFGLELWLGNNADVPDTWAGWLHPSDNLAQRAEFLKLGEIAYMREKQHEALQFMATHPLDVSRFFWRRFVENWTTIWDPIQDVWHAIGWQEKIALASNMFVVLTGFVGLLLLFRQKNEFAWPVSLFPLLYPIVYYVTHPSRRYRHPIDPILVMLTAVAVTYPFAARAAAKSPKAVVIPIASQNPEVS
jgi:Dolichyl-phosphate-mannose-protein mannosyltransferase